MIKIITYGVGGGTLFKNQCFGFQQEIWFQLCWRCIVCEKCPPAVYDQESTAQKVFTSNMIFKLKFIASTLHSMLAE